MNQPFSQFADSAFLDAAKALPAALARILLGGRGEREKRFIVALQAKFVALMGSLALAVTAGDLARGFAQAAPYANLIVIAAAFTAQDAVHILIRRSRRYLRSFSHDRHRKTNRNEDED